MYIVRRYVIRLSDQDYVTIDMGFDPPNEMVDACVNYVASIRGQWTEVGRYDTAHGIPHVHRFWLGAESVRPLPGLSPHELVETGKRDFLMNWQRYRSRLEAGPI